MNCAVQERKEKKGAIAATTCCILDLLFHQSLERLKKIKKYLIKERQYMERGPFTPTTSERYCHISWLISFLVIKCTCPRVCVRF